MANTDRRRLWGLMALDWARQALADAERKSADDDEILPLCDEVIRGRLRVQQCDLDAGWEPPASVRFQMARDRALLTQTVTERHGVARA